jgi:hypothetical protein
MILSLIVLLLFGGAKQGRYLDGHYSTCPPPEEAVYRSVLYTRVSERQLRNWAIVSPTPKPSKSPERVKVYVQIEGTTPFCAQAESGALDKQKLAVDSVMEWKFKSKRGDFKDDIAGTIALTF